ncbi:nucleoside phosphorylase [Enterococcus diestrammenae]|uniref:nucleoside phosphorylase n=1 Tax=Enterococcus diestrammenae TaxID=1155073 RepID=UPI0022E58B9A|nr:nucleoside phosphorylase [Enterococcus diestrammenae]
MLLEEFDSIQQAVINPAHSDTVFTEEFGPLPKTILCPFSGDVIQQLLITKQLQEIGYTQNINGRTPIYLMRRENKDVLVMLAKVGEPACINTLEDLAPLGVEHFILFGSCGVLDKNLASDQINLPIAALRDEGLSHHYAPPSDQILADPNAILLMEKVLQENGIQYEKGITWTTDAFFRETPAKLLRRKEQGAIYVDMEAAGTFAWSQFRGHHLYHFFYSADHLHTNGWDRRLAQRRRHTIDFFEVALLFADEIAG